MRNVNILKSNCFIFAVFIIVYKLLIQQRQCYISNSDEEITSLNCFQDHSRDNCMEKHINYIKVTWYAPPVFLINRPNAMLSGFNGCSFNNCKMSYVMPDAALSDAVIFTGRKFPEKLPFTRPMGQIWIFFELEPPYRYSELSNGWNKNNIFNWTMTYDRSVSDIHLPYGQIMNKRSIGNTNYDEIMKRKNRTALIIMSHCDTPSHRLRYIKELNRYIEVDILGQCGINWECGQRFLHDGCFNIISSYKFYLAFENSLCNNYFTEKVFENFDYDTVLVSRGGKKGQNKQILPEGTFISTDDFENASELGIYLKSMSDDTYVDILKRKQQYTSLDTYPLVFRKAMCNICFRLNNVNKFKKSIKDMNYWAYHSKPCVQSNDFI